MDGMLLLYIIQIDYIQFIFDKSIQNLLHGTLDHFLSEKVMVFDNFLAADKHK